MRTSRRDFIKLAAAMGASLAWTGPARASRTQWQERRDLYPEGVASGDPDATSVILWTRRPFGEGERHILTVEVAEDEAFQHVIAHAPAPVSAAGAPTTTMFPDTDTESPKRPPRIAGKGSTRVAISAPVVALKI